MNRHLAVAPIAGVAVEHSPLGMHAPIAGVAVEPRAGDIVRPNTFLITNGFDNGNGGLWLSFRDDSGGVNVLLTYDRHRLGL